MLVGCFGVNQMNTKEIHPILKKKKDFYKLFGVNGAQCQLEIIIIDGLRIFLCNVSNLMRISGFVKKNSDAEMVIKEGGFALNNKTITDPKSTIGFYKIGGKFEFL